ncbi:GTP cyclohydrolase 1 feedback regulatory protein-like [Salmo trutta]|nr:GTP cyclohydrolase 1 feedback regulatory protein-like [Salmo trutta]
MPSQCRKLLILVSIHTQLTQLHHLKHPQTIEHYLATQRDSKTSNICEAFVKMQYILISTLLHLETGPTTVGDEFSDTSIINYLGARKTKKLGNNFWEYHVEDSPWVVLDKLEKVGFSVVTMTGVGQTMVWCLNKDTIM